MTFIILTNHLWTEKARRRWKIVIHHDIHGTDKSALDGESKEKVDECVN